MIVLTIRTDKPRAEVGLFDDGEALEYIEWEAHRELSGTLHNKIDVLLNNIPQSKTLGGIIFYAGPGSFTGLRIGASVANALAYSLNAPCVSVAGSSWIADGFRNLQEGFRGGANPEYGSAPHITQAKK